MVRIHLLRKKTSGLHKVSTAHSRWFYRSFGVEWICLAVCGKQHRTGGVMASLESNGCALQCPPAMVCGQRYTSLLYCLAVPTCHGVWPKIHQFALLPCSAHLPWCVAKDTPVCFIALQCPPAMACGKRYPSLLYLQHF